MGDFDSKQTFDNVNHLNTFDAKAVIGTQKWKQLQQEQLQEQIQTEQKKLEKNEYKKTNKNTYTKTVPQNKNYNTIITKTFDAKGNIETTTTKNVKNLPQNWDHIQQVTKKIQKTKKYKDVANFEAYDKQITKLQQQLNKLTNNDKTVQNWLNKDYKVIRIPKQENIITDNKGRPILKATDGFIKKLNMGLKKEKEKQRVEKHNQYVNKIRIKGEKNVNMVTNTNNVVLNTIRNARNYIPNKSTLNKEIQGLKGFLSTGFTYSAALEPHLKWIANKNLSKTEKRNVYNQAKKMHKANPEHEVGYYKNKLLVQKGKEEHEKKGFTYSPFYKKKSNKKNIQLGIYEINRKDEKEKFEKQYNVWKNDKYAEEKKQAAGELAIITGSVPVAASKMAASAGRWARIIDAGFLAQSIQSEIKNPSLIGKGVVAFNALPFLPDLKRPKGDFLVVEHGEMVPLLDRKTQVNKILDGEINYAITGKSNLKSRNKPSIMKKGDKAYKQYPEDYTYEVAHKWATMNVGKSLPIGKVMTTAAQGRTKGIPNIEILKKGKGFQIIKLNKSEKEYIKKTLQNEGKLPEKTIKWMYKKAQEQATKASTKTKKRVLVATLSPKRTRGFGQPELEMSLVFPKGKYKNPSQYKLKGLGINNALVFAEKGIKPTQFLRNLNHLKHYFKEVARDKQAYLLGAKKYAGEYAQHGKEHLVKSWNKHLKKYGLKPEKYPLDKYHDIVKVTDVETFPEYPHGKIAAKLFKKKLIKDPAYQKLNKKEKWMIRNAWAGHEYYRPSISSLFTQPGKKGIKAITIPTKDQLKYYAYGKINPDLRRIASIDRIDLQRFGLEVDERMIAKEFRKNIKNKNRQRNNKINKQLNNQQIAQTKSAYGTYKHKKNIKENNYKKITRGKKYEPYKKTKQYKTYNKLKNNYEKIKKYTQKYEEKPTNKYEENKYKLAKLKTLLQKYDYNNIKYGGKYKITTKKPTTYTTKIKLEQNEKNKRIPLLNANLKRKNKKGNKKQTTDKGPQRAVHPWGFMGGFNNNLKTQQTVTQIQGTTDLVGTNNHIMKRYTGK